MTTKTQFNLSVLFNLVFNTTILFWAQNVFFALHAAFLIITIAAFFYAKYTKFFD